MKSYGNCIDFADGIIFDGGYYFGDSIDGIGEGIYKEFAVSPDVLYAISFVHKMDFGQMDLLLYDVSNFADISTIQLTDTTWQSFEYSFQTPASCSTVRVKITQHDKHSTPFYIDNFSLNGNAILIDPDTYSREPEFLRFIKK